MEKEEIILQSPPNVNDHYFTGSTIKGMVLLRSKKDTDVIAAHLWFCGGVSIEQKQRHSLPSSQGYIYFRTHCEEEIVREYHALLYNGTDTSFTVSPGKPVSLAFQITIPHQAPSTVPGRLIYQVATIIETRKKLLESNLPILVLQDLDLTENLEFLRSNACRKESQPCPASLLEAEKPIDIFNHMRISGVAGLIQAHLSVPCRWLVLGQKVSARVEIKNRTTVNLKDVCLVISMKTSFIGNSLSLGFQSRLEKRRVVASISLGKIRSGEEYVANEDVCSQLRVPLVPPSGLRYSAIGDVQYTLELQCHDGWQELIYLGKFQNTQDNAHLYEDWEGGHILSAVDLLIGVRPLRSRLSPEAATDITSHRKEDATAPAQQFCDILPPKYEDAVNSKW